MPTFLKLALIFLPILAHAGKPIFTITPSQTPDSVIYPDEIFEAAYWVTNNTPFTLENNKFLALQAGIAAYVTSDSCANPFTLATGQACLLRLKITANDFKEKTLAGGPIVCNNTNNPVYCSRPSSGNELSVTLQPTPSGTPTLQFLENGLVINSLSLNQNDIRTIQIQNIGTSPVINLTIFLGLAWKNYLSGSCLTTTQLSVGATCNLTFSVPLDTYSGTQPLFARGKNISSQLPVSINTTGRPTCWGINAFGQLGNSTNVSTVTANPTPSFVQNLGAGSVQAITLGNDNTCALLSGTQGVQCWGVNLYGQLGTTLNSGTNTRNTIPQNVQNLSSGIKQIGTGSTYNCALEETGSIQCWGINNYGQLGSLTNAGTSAANNVPLAVSNIPNAISIAVGTYHACALLDTGVMNCWGLNHYGELGNPIHVNDASEPPNPTPVLVQGLENDTVISITAGAYHTCALLATGVVKCWGWNNYGQIGNNAPSGPSAVAQAVPLVVPGLPTDITFIQASVFGTCAGTSTGATWCWGINTYGQLGNGFSSIAPNPIPSSVLGLPSAALTASGGNNFNCLHLAGGQIRCAGLNQYGQLGNATNSGTTNANRTPLQVLNLAGYPVGLFQANISSASCALII